MAKRATTKQEQDLRGQVWDDGPGSLGIALPRGAEMGLRLYRLGGGSQVNGHTLEVDMWKLGAKVYIRKDADGEVRVIYEDSNGRERLR